nr:hypothetical protein [Streptomyces californicus]
MPTVPARGLRARPRRGRRDPGPDLSLIHTGARPVTLDPADDHVA